MIPELISEHVLHDLEPVERGLGEPLLHSLEEEQEGGRRLDVLLQELDQVLDGAVVDVVGKTES